MHTIRKRKKVKVLPILLAATICFSNHFEFVSNAKGTTKTRQTLENDLSELNKDKAAIAQELSAATASLNATVSEIKTTQQELGIARARSAGQYELMKRRIKYIYECTPGNFLSIFSESESLTDLLNKAEYISALGEYDRTMLKKLKEIESDIEQKEQKLLKQQENLTSQQKLVSSKYKQLTTQINNKANDLAAYKKQLAQAEEAKNASNNIPNENPSGSKPSTPTHSENVALFAAILECEAGSTNYSGLLAVATVIMNRVESPRFPNTLKGVIYQSGQFSPAWTGRLDKVLERGPRPLCYTAAKAALNGARYAPVKHCYFFRSASTGVSGINVGGNVFF